MGIHLKNKPKSTKHQIICGKFIFFRAGMTFIDFLSVSIIILLKYIINKIIKIAI